MAETKRVQTLECYWWSLCDPEIVIHASLNTAPDFVYQISTVNDLDCGEKLTFEEKQPHTDEVDDGV